MLFRSGEVLSDGGCWPVASPGRHGGSGSAASPGRGC